MPLKTASQRLLTEIDSFLKDSGMSASYLGRVAVNDGKLVARLRSGGRVLEDKADAVRAFMREERERIAAGQKRVLKPRKKKD
jgi:hypothetical protein